jgi:AraC-like DNA-binding protein
VNIVRTSWVSAAARACQVLCCGEYAFQMNLALLRGSYSAIRATVPPENRCEELIMIGMLTSHLLERNELAEASSRQTPHSIGTLIVDSPARRAKETIDVQYSQPLSISGLSKSFACHPRTLQREFRRLYGLSVHQYILIVRGTHAHRLLVEHRDKVDAVALEVGFKSRSSLYRCLKALGLCTRSSTLRSRFR